MADNDLTAIREGFKAVLESVLPSVANGGPRVYARSRSGMSVPFILIRPVRGKRERMQQARRRYDFMITLALGQGMDSENWEARMDDYCATNGEMSIETALNSDKTLDGSTEMIDVQEFINYGEPIDINGIDFVGAQFPVDVWGKEPT